MIRHAVDASQMVQQIGHVITGHRCIYSLPKIPRISEGEYFVTGTGNRRTKFQLRPIYFALWDLNSQSLPSLHSFSGADITGT